VNKAGAIIVAAGSSRRLGFDKLKALIDGRAVLERTMEAFDNCSAIGGIVIVTSAEKVEELDQWRVTKGYRKLLRAVEGGAERHLSVANGLAALPAGFELVAVHDGARPLVTPQRISDCVEAAAKHGAASLAHRISETLKRADAQGIVRDSVDRENLWAMETPQVAQRDLLENAYRYVLAEGLLVTDEVSALAATGTDVHLVENPQPNPKITFPADLPLAEALLKSRKS